MNEWDMGRGMGRAADHGHSLLLQLYYTWDRSKCLALGQILPRLVLPPLHWQTGEVPGAALLNHAAFAHGLDNSKAALGEGTGTSQAHPKSSLKNLG